jgi:hypothetical protein
MARIDWALLCDAAFLDAQNRLCVVGVIDRLPVSQLPLAIGRMTLVARLTDIEAVDQVRLSVGIVAPSGSLVPSGDCAVKMVREYMLVTIHNWPIHEEGTYRFRVDLSTERPVFVNVAVSLPVGQPTGHMH